MWRKIDLFFYAADQCLKTIAHICREDCDVQTFGITSIDNKETE